ncbi:hypothetical protein [Dyella sp. C11]|uniref:hypothetical protein n=1 Tax=Dyella sp. C11 TaxID=2126991 RepID=UPI0013004FB9|nr:hypothetical protein [Dyella sp. C11]
MTLLSVDAKVRRAQGALPPFGFPDGGAEKLPEAGIFHQAIRKRFQYASFL